MSLFGNNLAERALDKINQHMHDCELRAAQAAERAAGLEAKLEAQDDRQDEMHKANTARMDKSEEAARGRYLVLMMILVTTLIGMVTTLSVALIQLNKHP